MSIRENLLKVRSEIERASSKSGVKNVTLVGISKTAGPAEVNEAIRCGLTDIGENRVQEAESKFPKISKSRRHFVGHLQSNKAAKAAVLFDMIQTVDSIKIACKISNICVERNIVMPVLIQVRTDECKDFGFCFADVRRALEEMSTMKNMRVMGLMTIGQYHENPEDSRPMFREMKSLFDSLKGIPNAEMRYLSMGMSNDFGIAIEEGANMVRVGTAIFGARDSNRI